MLFDQAELISWANDAFRKDMRTNARSQSHTDYLLEWKMIMPAGHDATEQCRANLKGLSNKRC